MRLSDVGVGEGFPEIVNVIVEIPKGSSNKYEVDAESGVIRLDRVLYSPLFYPCEYGYIPGTRYTDGDPLDAMVLCSHSTFPGCVLEAKPIALLLMKDEKGRDDKVLCVAVSDPRFTDVNRLEDIGDHLQREIMHFFEVYKQLEEKSVEVLGWDGVKAAQDLIVRYRIPFS